MSRTRLVLIAGVAAIVAGVLIATSGWAQAPTSLRLVATAQDSVGFQPKHDPPRPGGRGGFGNTITGDDTGSLRGVCTIIAKNQTLCTVGIQLSKGTLAGQALGSMRPENDSGPANKMVFAITGGTGAYDGARGTGGVTPVPGTPRSDIQITLRP